MKFGNATCQGLEIGLDLGNWLVIGLVRKGNATGLPCLVRR